MTEEIITEKYFDNHEDDFQDFTYYTVREGMHIHLYDAIKKQNKYVEKMERKLKRLEQENKELKEKVKSLESEIRQKKMTIMMNNDHYLTVDENNRKYRSVLEEIKKIIKSYNLAVDNGVSVDTLYTIKKIINEVISE